MKLKTMLTIILLLIVSLISTQTYALTPGDMISSSGATPTQWGDHTIIETQNGSVINWSNFNTSSKQSVTFEQYLDGKKNSSSAVLNRITSGSIPTIFNGALTANGRVFVVNPAGIIFSGSSVINVPQLMVSGQGITDQNFNQVVQKGLDHLNLGEGTGQVQILGTVQSGLVLAAGDNFSQAIDRPIAASCAPRPKPPCCPEPQPDTEPEPEPEPKPNPPGHIFIPGLQSESRIPTIFDLDKSGCPALVKWLIGEVGGDPKKLQIYMTSGLASPTEIFPCELCSQLRGIVLSLSKDPIVNRTEFVDAFVQYVDLLSDRLNIPKDQAIILALDRYWVINHTEENVEDLNSIIDEISSKL